MKVEVDKKTGALIAKLTDSLYKITYPDGRVVYGVPQKAESKKEPATA